MRRIIEDRRLIHLVVLCLFVGGVALTDYAYRLDQRQQLAQLRDRVLEQAAGVRSDIEHQVNTSLNLHVGLAAYVATKPDISQQEFDAMAARILERARYIRNIGLARDNVVSHIYPLEGNLQALGLRYLDMPEQQDAVLRAIESRHSVIAGPVELVQGGMGFISRIPIFLDKERTRYWGMASVVMNVEDFFREAGLDRYGADLKIALRGKDSLGAAGDVFYGDARLFGDANAVQLPIALREGGWILAAAPQEGWQGDGRRGWMILGIGVGISLIASLLLFVLLDLLAALSKANQRAEQASAHKARFFSHMTHELRTPLTAIQGVVSLLASGKLKLDAEQSGELLQNALRNCQRLQWIVNDMLDLKKLESGTAWFAAEPQSVADLIEDSVDGIELIARHYGVELKIDNRVDAAVRVSGDRIRLQQVLTNLLSNAIKYSPESGVVDIRAFGTADGVRVEVIDQGEGVSEDKLHVIFEEFSQDKPSNKNSIASTGLGLSISKHIIDQHGGRIGCRNIPTGGCCFYIELPAAAPAQVKA